MKRVLLCLLVFCIASFPLLAAEPAFKALLVSIEDYEKAPLDFAEQDIGKLSTVLLTRYGCMVKMCLNRSGMDRTPKETIVFDMKDWFGKLESDDNALIYLSGHGVKDDDGKLYLAMIDFDGKNFETAAIPLEMIRKEFENCQGKSKLLLIDTCFAGTSKSFDFNQATSGEMSDVFKEISNVAIIASCRKDERSWLWTEKKHSLFTYWLIEAFKGHALDNKRKLTFDGLTGYLEANVPLAAKFAVNQNQHPVVHNPEAGEAFELSMKGIPLKNLIDDIAEQIDLKMRMEKKYTLIGLPEFTMGPEKTLDPAFANLSRDICRQLREKLKDKSQWNESGYEVMNENALNKILIKDNIKPGDLGTSETRHLKITNQGTEMKIPVLVDGHITLIVDQGANLGVMLSTELLNTQTGGCIGKGARGVAYANARELGLTGVSFDFARIDEMQKFGTAQPPKPHEPRQPEPGEPQQPPLDNLNFPQSVVTAAIQIHRDAQEPHPMSNTSLPFKVWFEVRKANERNAQYKERRVIFDSNNGKIGSNCYLPLDKGEVYRIMIQNNDEKEVFARVLVDGLNTLSQRQPYQAKGAWIEKVESETGAPYVLAPRTNLDDARAWVMVPKRTPYAIEGFYDANFKNDTLHRFIIVDADQSAINRENYTDQIGYITLGFFKAIDKPSPGTRAGGLITDPGAAEPQKLNAYQGGKMAGEMIAVYNIRYMTPEALNQRVPKSQQSPGPQRPVIRW